MAEVAIEIDAGLGAGAAGTHQGPDAAVALADEPKTIAADVVHVRIDRRDCRRHRHHCFDRVAPLGKNCAPGLRGGMMRSGHDAAAVSGGVKVMHDQMESPGWRC